MKIYLPQFRIRGTESKLKISTFVECTGIYTSMYLSYDGKTMKQLFWKLRAGGADPVRQRKFIFQQCSRTSSSSICKPILFVCDE